MLRFLDRREAAVLAQDPLDTWAGHNCDQHHFNRLLTAGALEECGVAFHEFDNVVYNCRGIMQEEVKRLGRAGDMKLRNLPYSATGPATAREVFRKIGASLGGQLRRG
jgi:hypothetical protein